MHDEYPALVVLAGGISSRLWPLKDKSLLEFCGIPLLKRQLDLFLGLGFHQILIVANPENRSDVEGLANGLSHRCSVTVFTQPQPKGMGDALLRLRDYLNTAGNPSIYITQVHDVFDPGLHMQVMDAVRMTNAAGILAAKKMEFYFPGGYLTLEPSDGAQDTPFPKIVGIVEKPGLGNEPPGNLVTFVAHLHRRPAELLDCIQSVYDSGWSTDDHYERAMAQMMAHHEYRAALFSGEWRAIKYPWEVLGIMDYFLQQLIGAVIAEDVEIPPTAIINGPVQIESGVRIFAGACIRGPAYIGARTVVGNNALIRESMVGSDCVVGYSTEIARSYVGNDAWFHTNYVGDSVISDKVQFGSGAVTANLRLDKNHVASSIKGSLMDTRLRKLGAIVGERAQVGINASLMPGIKIGRGSLVGPGVILKHDLPDWHSVFAQHNLVISAIKQSGDGSLDEFRSRL